MQVADRWHLWHNLAGHIERTVLRHRRCLRELPHPDDADDADAPSAAEDPEPSEPVVAPERELPIVVRTRERHQAITDLRSAGATISAIARTLRLDRKTVRRFVRASGPDELQAKTLQRATLLDGYTDYLHQRWTQGSTDAAALTTEITAFGYRGSEQTVRRYLRPLRDGRPAPSPSARSPSAAAASPSTLQRRLNEL